MNHTLVIKTATPRSASIGTRHLPPHTQLLSAAKLPYWYPIAAFDGKRRVPHSHNQLLRIYFPRHAVLAPGEKLSSDNHERLPLDYTLDPRPTLRRLQQLRCNKELTQLATSYYVQQPRHDVIIQPLLHGLKSLKSLRTLSVKLKALTPAVLINLRKVLARLPNLTSLTLETVKWTRETKGSLLPAGLITEFFAVIATAPNLKRLELSLTLLLATPELETSFIRQWGACLAKLGHLRELAFTVHEAICSSQLFPELAAQCCNSRNLKQLSFALPTLAAWPDGILAALAKLELAKINLTLNFNQLSAEVIRDFTEPAQLVKYANLNLIINFSRTFTELLNEKEQLFTGEIQMFAGLANYLPLNPRLNQLHIIFGQLTRYQNLECLAKVIPHASRLRDLALKIEMLSIEEGELFCERLKDFSQLTSLKLTAASHFLSTQLVTTLPLLTNLTKLELNFDPYAWEDLENYLGYKQVKQLGMALEKMPQLQALSLDFSGNEDVVRNGFLAKLSKQDGNFEFFAQPDKLSNLRALSLKLDYTAKLSAAGLLQLAKQLRQLPKLTQLELSLCVDTRIKAADRQAFYRQLQALPHLQQLTLVLNGYYQMDNKWLT
jgi:hypothetical protein